MRSRDVPGVTGNFGVGAEQGGDQHRELSPGAAFAPGRRRADDALAAINVDQALTNGVLDKLQALPDVVEVRLANFGD